MSVPPGARPAPAAPTAVAIALTLLLALSVLPLGDGELKFLLLTVTGAGLAIALGAGGLLARPERRVLAPALFLVTWAGLTLSWAPDRYRGVTAWLWLVSLALPALAAGRLGARAWPAIAAAVLVVGSSSLAIGIAQYGAILPAPDWANPIRLAGSFVNSNLYAAWCGVVLLVASGTVLDPGVAPALRALGALALALAAASLPLTASRGGWLAAALGLAVFATLRQRQTLLRRVPWRGLGLALFLLASAGVVLAVVGGGRVAERLTHAGTYSLSHRLAIWLGTADLIRAHPFGVGVGGFEAAFPPFRFHSDRFTVNFAHSDALELVAVLGFPGAIALAMLLRAALPRSALERAASSPLGAGLVAALAALAVQSLYDFPLRKPTLGVFAAAALGALTHGEPEPGRRPIPRRAAALAAAVLLALTLPLVRGELLRADGERLAATGAAPAAERSLARADRWLWPGDFALARAAGDWNLRLARLPTIGALYLERACAWLGVAARRNPGSAEARLALAVALDASGRPADARRQFLDAVALAPQDGQVLLTAARFLDGSGDLLAAHALESRALDTSPVRMFPSRLAEAAERRRLPAEAIALAPAPASTRLPELARALDARGLLLAARLTRARGASAR